MRQQSVFHEMESRLSSASVQSLEGNERAKVLSIELREARQTTKELKTQLQDSNNKCMKLHEDVKDLHKQRGDLQQLLEGSRTKHKTVEHEMVTLQREKHDICKELAVQHESSAFMTKEVKQLRAALVKLRHQNEVLLHHANNHTVNADIQQQIASLTQRVGSHVEHLDQRVKDAEAEAKASTEARYHHP